MFNEQETPFATFRAGRSTHVQEGTDEALQLFFHVDREIDARHAARLTASLATGAVTAVPSTSTQAAWLLYEMGLSKRLNSPLVSSAMPSAPGLLAMTGDQGPGAAHPARPIVRASSIWQHHRWQLRQTVSPSAPQSAPSITSSVAPSGHVSRAARTWRSSSTALNDRTMQPGLCVNSSISSFISSFSSVAASVHTSVATSVHTSVKTSVPRTLDPSGSPSANEGRNQHAISLDPSGSPTAVAEVDQAAKIVPKKASKGSARPTSAPINLEPNLEQDLKPNLGSNPSRNSSLNRYDTCLLEDAHDDAKSLSMSLPLASPAASPAAMHIVMPDFMPSSLRAFSSGNGARPLTEVAPWTLTNHAPAPSRALLPSPSSYVSRAHALTTAGSPTAGSTAGNTAGSTAGSASTLASRAPSYLIRWAPSEMTSETQSLTQSPHRQPPHPSLVTNPRPGTTINLTNPRPSTTINRSLESIHTSQPRARLKSVPQHQSSPKLTPAGTQMTGDVAHYGALSRPHSASTGATPSVKAALRTYALNHATIATSILPQPRLVTRLG